MKLRSPRTGLFFAKESEELSTKLEFDEFDDMPTDGGQPKGKDKGQPSPEKTDEGGKGEEGVCGRWGVGI